MAILQPMRHAKATLLCFGAYATFFTASPGFAALLEIDIDNLPLHPGVDLRPNLLLSLSIDITSVRAAYRAGEGDYNRNKDYIGYFNSRKCYRYHDGKNKLSDGYFVIEKDADQLRECSGDAFSGNFMNWATSSQIDILRYALTGGDRIVDTAQLSVLQRAVLPDSFYANQEHFPRKKISAGPNASAPNRVTPFAVPKLYIVNCRDRILFSDSINPGSDCDTPAAVSGSTILPTDKKLGEYLARVRVCDANEGPTRTELCRKYGKTYKPVGLIQKYADSMRIGVMGYLLDDSKSRYGGVLRSSLKFVGATKQTGPGLAADKNEFPEWDEITGILYPHPDDRSHAPGMNSGSINYLNKFGRLGRYKIHDPLSELYYEGLRYLQGKPATPDASAGMSQAMKEGFPVLDSRADPVTAACQRNYILAMADADTAWDRYVPGNQRRLLNDGSNAHDLARAAEPRTVGKWPGLDVKVWTHKLAALESEPQEKTGNPAQNSSLSDLQNKDAGTSGRGTYYMSGLAYWANVQDIRYSKPGRVKTYVLDLDAGGNGQLDGSARIPAPRESQLYLAAKYGGFDDINGDGNPFVTLADDGRAEHWDGSAEWDTDGDGRPDRYFLGGRPSELVDSIRRIFAEISNERVAKSRSGVALSSPKIDSGTVHLYQAGFDPRNGSGSLKKIALHQQADGGLVPAAMADWDAGNLLTGAGDKAPLPTPDQRKIYTLKNQGGLALATVPFLWESLAAEQQRYLSADASSVLPQQSPDVLGALRIDYLRGARALESNRQDGFFRVRSRVLGDIVHSAPVYVAGSVAGSANNKNLAFKSGGKNGRPMVYVGANDGMLHAFDADTGEEVFAYVPNALIPVLYQLTEPEYAHRTYLGGTPAVADITFAGKRRKILASGFGAGAQGVFALDVSQPAHFGDEGGALWEFTDSDDPDMGNVSSPPQIARFRTRSSNGVAEYKYFAVVPSGLNNYSKDGTGKYSNTARAALFLLSLEKDLSAKWQAGINYYKIRLPVPDGSMANGLGSPSLLPGADGAVRYAYVGDLQGNLWRFDFSGSAPWSSALGSAAANPVFIARDEGGQRQPISMQPTAVFAPGGFLILFGTGKYIESADLAPGGFKTQSFYGIYDRPELATKTGGRNELAARHLKHEGGDLQSQFEITGKALSIGNKAQDKKGWYFDFSASALSGERSVSNLASSSGRIYFNTLIPAKDACAPVSGRSYTLDALSGLSPAGMPTGYLSDLGALNSPLILEATVETGNRDTLGKRLVKKKRTVLDTGTGGPDGIALKPRPTEEQLTLAGRLSWREILNWQELRDAAIKK